MKRYLKRFLTLVLTAGLVLGCVSVEGFAAETKGTEDTDSGEEITDVAETSELEPLPDDPEYALLNHQEAVEEDNGIATLSLKSTGEITAWGIDVSYYQGDIDWAKVKKAGVDFAIIRVGYRGGSEGELHKDTKAEQNLQGAIDAGIQVGAYFFSTALNETEALEEAKYTVDIIKNYEITYPVAYDCEGYYTSGYRDYGLSSAQRSKNADTFLNYVESCDYAGILYENKSNLSDGQWELDTLAERYAIWVAQYPYYNTDSKTLYSSYQQAVDKSASTSYTGDYQFWQFTSSGSVDGITGNDGKVDLDFEYKTTGSISSQLATPVLKSATASSSGTQISWDSVSGAKGYAVFRKKSGGSWSRIAMTTSTSYTDKESLTNGTTYYYTVRAYRGSQSQALARTYQTFYWSSYDSAGLETVYIKTPALSGVSTTTTGLKVSWSAVSGATGYSVHRKTSGGSWSTVGTTTSTSYTDTTAKSGTTYYYTVRAYRGSDATSHQYDAKYWSGYDSSGVSGKFLAAPVLQSAKAVANGTTVSWSAMSGANGYAIFRKQSGGSWKRLDTTTSTSYTDKESLTNGTTYYYTVRAYTGSESKALANTYSTSYWSGYDSAGISSVYIKTPTLSGVSATTTGLKVSWSAVSGATGYSVHRKTSGGSWTTLGTTTSTSYTDKTAKSGTTYYYTVRAYRGNDATSHQYDAKYWGGYNSSGVSGKFLAAPVLQSAKAVAGGTQVSWSAVSGASGYAVFRKQSGGSWKRLDTTTSTSYTDKESLTSGKTYYYTVRAYTGTKSKALANTYSTSYWSGYDSAGIANVYLKAPALTGTTNQSAGIKVSWNAVSGATGYSVHRKTAGGNWHTLGTTTSTSYTDTTAKEGVTYYYTVRAYHGSSATSHQYDAKYWGGYDSGGISAEFISTPVLQSATAASSGINVTWNAVSGVSGYAVYRKESGGSWKRLDTTTSTSYTDKESLTNGTTYYYTVRAYKGTKSKALANTYQSTYWSSYNSAGVSVRVQ